MSDFKPAVVVENPGRWVYATSKWKALRTEHLEIEPLCRYHQQIGVVVAATVVDHIIPHRGDAKLAFDRKNLQSLCKPCHDSLAQKKDHGAPVKGFDANGWPLDEKHFWGKSKVEGEK